MTSPAARQSMLPGLASTFVVLSIVTLIAWAAGSLGAGSKGLAGFSPTAADLELIVPNMTNDMHDGTVAQGDAFLRAFVPRITRSSAFATSLLLITWDEGSTNLGGGGRVATIVVSPRVSAGFRSSISHSHYSIVRTIEDAWALGCLNHTCTSNDLREFFAR